MMTKRSRTVVVIGIIAAGLAAAAYSGYYVIAQQLAKQKQDEYTHLADCEAKAIQEDRAKQIIYRDEANNNIHYEGGIPMNPNGVDAMTLNDWGIWKQQVQHLNDGGCNTSYLTPP